MLYCQDYVKLSSAPYAAVFFPAVHLIFLPEGQLRIIHPYFCSQTGAVADIGKCQLGLFSMTNKYCYRPSEKVCPPEQSVQVLEVLALPSPRAKLTFQQMRCHAFAIVVAFISNDNTISSSNICPVEAWMQHLGTWLSGHGGDGLTLGLDELRITKVGTDL